MNTTPTNRHEHQRERDEVARLVPELVERDLPGDRRRQLQEFVMNEIHQDIRQAAQAARRPRWWRPVALTSAVAGGLAAVVALSIGFGAIQSGTPERGGANHQAGPDGGSKTVVSPATQTFELVAAYAAAQPYTKPRPNQWIYIKNRNLAPSNLAKDKGQKAKSTYEVWKRADGVKMSEFNPDTGKLDIWVQDNEYPVLSTLPTDPQELLSVLRADLTRTPDPSDPRPHLMPADDPDVDAWLFRRVAQILDGNLLPPAVTAALWRAAALIPGVTQSDKPIKIDGRQVIAVGRVQEGWQFEQLLVDPDTHEYVGYRSVAVKDHTYEGTPSGPVTEKAGHVQYATTRLAAAVVNAAGDKS